MVKSYSNFLKSGILFLFLCVGLVWAICRFDEPSSIIEAVKGASPVYVLCGIVAMTVFLSCDGINTAQGLKLQNHKISFLQSFKYACTGFFFSSITPSASGGQPAQMYQMYCDGIPAAHSTIALFMNLASFQTVSILMALVGFCINKRYLTANGAAGLAAALGITLNLCVLLIVVAALLSPKAMKKILRIFFAIINILPGVSKYALKHSLAKQACEYRRCSAKLSENKGVFFKLLAITFVQLTAFFSIPFFVYKALTIDGNMTWVSMCTLQALLFVSVSALPLPGSVGVGEGGFLLLFRAAFSVGLIGSAMVLSRFISLYLFVVITGLVVVLTTAIRPRLAVS